MARPTEPNSIKSIAQRLSVALGFSVSQKMVREWKSKSYDIDDPEKLSTQLRNQEKLPKGMLPIASPTPPPDKPHGASITEEEVHAELNAAWSQFKTTTDYNELRALKTKIDGMKVLLQVLIDQGRYILKENAEKHAAQAAVAVKAELEKMEDGMPPQLEGKSALQMKSSIRDYVRSSLLELERVFTQ